MAIFFSFSCQRTENNGPLVEEEEEGGGVGAIGKEQDEGSNTINTRCCVGVGQAIYTEVVNQQDTTRQIILNASTVPCPQTLDNYTSHSNFREYIALSAAA